MSKHILKSALCILLVLFIAGCGGTTSPGDDGGGGDGGAPTALKLGFFKDNGDFAAGVIETNKSTLISGQSTTLTVAFVDSESNFVTEPTDIRFTSRCALDGLAVIEPHVASTGDGRVQVTYTARGCTGPDTITAKTRVTVGGQSTSSDNAAPSSVTLEASVTLQTRPAQSASIVFVSAEPDLIALKASGSTLPRQSKVTFKVTNARGKPAPGKTVNFTLNKTLGGISLSRTQDTSGPEGLVATFVSSGTVPTPIRVKATTMTNAGNKLVAVSSQLKVTTGIPDNDSVSLSAETLNIEGWQFDGETTEVTVRLADRFNNPAPDGTAVTFTVEGGAVDSSCQTVDGACTVTFRSQAPRPADGRVTVLATATGEEGFIDSNGDGRYSAGEPFVDLAEAFVDANENGQWDPGERFKDLDDDNSYSRGNNRFNGVLCGANCAANPTVHVRDSLVIVLSGSALFVSVSTDPIELITDGAPKNVVVVVQDVNGQVAPAGTTIEAEATQGKLVGETSYIQESTNTPVALGAGRFAFTLEPADEAGTGTFRVTVTTPNGVVSRGSATIVQKELTITIAPSSIDLDPGGQPQEITVTLQYTNGDPAPPGTRISAHATQGNITGPTSYTQGTNGKRFFTFTLEPGSDDDIGEFRVTVTTPKGLVIDESADIF